MGECEDVLSQADMCSFATSSCGELTAFYFCSLHSSLLAWPFIVPLPQVSTLLAMLYLLGSTANEFFSPALAEVSKRMKLSPTLAISAE